MKIRGQSPAVAALTASRIRLLYEVVDEWAEACSKKRAFTSGHEGWAIIREELDELWDEVKRDDLTAARAEAVQVAAMALRFLEDLYVEGDRG